jgi:acetoin utilization deacetylase AcuC-like enzyme
MALGASSTPVDYSQADQSIYRAGLLRLVRYEIKLALERSADAAGGAKEAPAKSSPPTTEVRRLLEKLDHEEPHEDLPCNAQDPRVIFEGAVDADTPSFFTSFPFTLTALMQAADLDLSFFNIRFILNCLTDGTAQNLFACLVDGLITGLVYLRRKPSFPADNLEIKYIASAKDARSIWLQKHPQHRGVGTFLVAGVWLLWKNEMPRVREITLNAESQAMTFYERIGFRKRRPYVYALDRPAGYLLNALVVMADRSRFIRADVIDKILDLIRLQVRMLYRRPPGNPQRENALAVVKLCLLSRSRPLLAKTTAKLLLRYKDRIPEADNLLQTATDHGRIRLVDQSAATAQPLLVFKDEVMYQHLQGIFHLENANRLKAIDNVLNNGILKGKWTPVDGRPAKQEELAWVHTADHIASIAATTEKTLHCIDLDTQTTKCSYAAASLAVGGIFNLLDAMMSTPSRRGFAAVRPPGHHAEPNKAMGFCLFNNTALGASYLKHTKGLKRVMVVDIDAHHGNGTQKAFYNSKEVMYVSMHQFPCYPGSGNLAEVGEGSGEGYTINVPLDKGMGDREFVQVMDRLVRPLAYAYSPEMILVSCGFDLYRQDRLAGLNGTPDGYAMITRQLCRIADSVCNGRIAFIMEGGYSIQGIRDCALSVIQELCNIPTFEANLLDKMISRSSTSFSALRKAIAIHKAYWPILSS